MFYNDCVMYERTMYHRQNLDVLNCISVISTDCYLAVTADFKISFQKTQIILLSESIVSAICFTESAEKIALIIDSLSINFCNANFPSREMRKIAFLPKS